METTKIILVDDHQIVRDGIKALLKDEESVKILAEAQSGEEILDLLGKVSPDMLIMDISMPGASGIETAKQVSKSYPHVKLLFLSMFLNEDFILGAINAGAKGYLPKNTTKEELIQAINSIMQGKDYFNKEVSDIIMQNYVKKAKEKDTAKDFKVILTSREIEILKLFADGLTNQEIAELLFISVRTVESHKTHIMQKLRLKSTVELIKYAIKNNITSVE